MHFWFRQYSVRSSTCLFVALANLKSVLSLLSLYTQPCDLLSENAIGNSLWLVQDHWDLLWFKGVREKTSKLIIWLEMPVLSFFYM